MSQKKVEELSHRSFELNQRAINEDDRTIEIAFSSEAEVERGYGTDRWAWVDPKKDMEAAVLAMRNRIKPLRDIIAEAGDDIYDVLAKVKEDEELAASYGLKLDPDQIDNSEIVDESQES